MNLFMVEFKMRVEYTQIHPNPDVSFEEDTIMIAICRKLKSLLTLHSLSYLVLSDALSQSLNLPDFKVLQIYYYSPDAAWIVLVLEALSISLNINCLSKRRKKWNLFWRVHIYSVFIKFKLI